MKTDYWTLYGTTEPTPDPGNPPPPCIGQVWIRESDCRESTIVDMIIESGERVPYCFGVPYPPDLWPPEGAMLVYGPHAPWRGF